MDGSVCHWQVGVAHLREQDTWASLRPMWNFMWHESCLNSREDGSDPEGDMMAQTGTKARQRSRLLTIIVLGTWAVVAQGCAGAAHNDSDRGSAAQGGGGDAGVGTAGVDEASTGCHAGSERCACRIDGTCDTGLTCASDLCVDLRTVDSAGDGEADAERTGSAGDDRGVEYDGD